MADKRLKENQKATVKRVLDFIKPYRFFVWMSLLFALITVVTTLYAPIVTGNAIDFIVDKGRVDFTGLKPLLIKFSVVILITALSQWLMSLCNNRITYRVVKDIRTKVFDRLNHLPLKYIDNRQYGEVVSRIINDVDQFSEGLLMGFTQLFTGMITILGTLLFMLLVNWQITLVVVLITPVSLFVAGFIAKKTYSMFRLQSQSRGDMTALVEEMVGNQKIVQAFGYEDDAMRRFDGINEELSGYSLRAIFFSSLTNPATRFVNSLVYAGVGIVGAFIAVRGGITVGQLSCFLSYANQYTKPFNEISGVITEVQNAIACAARVFELLDEPVELPDAADSMVLSKEAVERESNIELKHVAFSYQKEKPLITDLNLSVRKGQRVAIVGPTGCGKSTLINLLMRFYDIDDGSIAINGTSIYKITRDSLRENYGMVLQETWLKSGTIAENIAYGRPEASREEIVEAAKACHAHSFIRRMPDGYDTVIGEDGGTLSQGQKQLLCIARVMLEIPPMLILDEATSSIDTRTEIRVQNAFAKLMKGRTSFIVAHRLSTIKEADVILVMKDGDIIEQGSHESLLKKNGFYAKLYYSQS
ncbi:MAG: ABC transporter ATP-binding protein/permease [Bacteroidales bacterium]|nr:ABC transporter ATP-binding protein/permease [Clostridium sp.]MCM1204081.1 ABC transporter ATP-binding protein/permease [Bacteroidales bacterium]